MKMLKGKSIAIIVLSVLLAISITIGFILIVKGNKAIDEFEQKHNITKNVLSAIEEENADYRFRNQALRDSFTELDTLYRDCLYLIMDFMENLDYQETDYNYWATSYFADEMGEIGDRYLEITGREDGDADIDYWEIEQ